MGKRIFIGGFLYYNGNDKYVSSLKQVSCDDGLVLYVTVRRQKESHRVWLATQVNLKGVAALIPPNPWRESTPTRLHQSRKVLVSCQPYFSGAKLRSFPFFLR